MKRIKNVNWKTATVAFLVTALALGAWQYLSSRTNQAQLQRTLEKEKSLSNQRLIELETHKGASEQLKEQFEKEKVKNQELEKQLQAKKASAVAHAAALQATPKPKSVSKATPSSGGSCASWMAAAGIPSTTATNKLIGGESGCRPGAVNPTSGACGIPQALPCSKMKCPLNDSGAVCQLKWMDAYAKARYGSWDKAYATWLSRSPHWY